ncbi:MAG: zinc ABC transporter substrate-binding protein [Nitrospinae bacterium]|nr:zinc ABC transporter substrate-binding protein [Nitrospinota bacterium]
MNVVTTTADIAALVKEVGGGHVSVTSISKGYQDPHYVEAKPSYMLKVNRADLLVYVGMELEIGYLPLLIEGGRNPNIRLGQPGLLDLSTAIVPIEVPVGEVDRSMGDVHPYGNPHYHLDPANGPLMAGLIADRLSLLDPDHAPEYKSNLENFRKRMEAKLKEWGARMEKFKGTRIVTYHLLWSYFMKRFGLEYAGVVENKPGISPSPKHLLELAETMKRQKIKFILMNDYTDPSFANLLKEKTGASVLILPGSVGGIPEVKDYTGLFDYLIAKVEQALSH